MNKFNQIPESIKVLIAELKADSRINALVHLKASYARILLTGDAEALLIVNCVDETLLSLGADLKYTDTLHKTITFQLL